jgi:hypothetical protein
MLQYDREPLSLQQSVAAVPERLVRGKPVKPLGPGVPQLDCGCKTGGEIRSLREAIAPIFS